MSSYRTLKIVAYAITLAFVTACSDGPKTNVAIGNEKGILHIANGDEPRGLDPHTTTGAPDAHVLWSMFEGLVTVDPKDLSPVPGVASSWEISEDQLTYTFHINPKARWSNGDPITAEDFRWSWMRALTPALANEFGYMMYFVKNAEAFHRGDTTDFSTVGVKVTDQYTLVVELERPTPFFLQMLDHHTYHPVHRATVEKFGDMGDRISKWTLPENFVGNGAFTLADWEINKVIRVVKNPYYWDADTVKLNEIYFHPIVLQQAEERAFRSGQVHLTYTPQMAIEKIATYREKSPELLEITPNYNAYWYLFNTVKPPFNDARVRKAVAYAIDREKLVTRVTKGGEVPAYTFVPPMNNGYQPKTYFHYDVEAARQLLAEAGYPNGEGFPTTEILYNTHENHRKIALAIQQMLKDNLNISVDLVNQEWKVYLNSQKNLDFDLCRQGWIADYLDPSNFFELLLSYAGNNNTGWKNEEYDRLVETAKNTLDAETRNQLYEQANKIASDEMPILPLYVPATINMKRPEVKGWYSNELDRHPYKHVYLDTSGE